MVAVVKQPKVHLLDQRICIRDEGHEPRAQRVQFADATSHALLQLSNFGKLVRVDDFVIGRRKGVDADTREELRRKEARQSTL